MNTFEGRRASRVGDRRSPPEADEFVLVGTPEQELVKWLYESTTVFKRFPYSQVIENDTQYDIDSLIEAYKSKYKEFYTNKKVNMRLFYGVLLKVCKKDPHEEDYY